MPSSNDNRKSTAPPALIAARLAVNVNRSRCISRSHKANGFSRESQAHSHRIGDWLLAHFGNQYAQRTHRAPQPVNRIEWRHAPRRFALLLSRCRLVVVVIASHAQSFVLIACAPSLSRTLKQIETSASVALSFTFRVFHVFHGVRRVVLL